MTAETYDPHAITGPEPWHRAEEEGNPQGYTYGPGQPFTRTRSAFSRELREEIARGRAEERADAILRRSMGLGNP